MSTDRLAPLYREAALQSRTSYLGGIRIARNPRSVTIVAAAWVCVVVGGVFLATGQVARKAQVPGLLVPALGLLQLTASSSGTLLERRVREGAFVQAGDVLFVVGTDRTIRGGESAVLISRSLRQRHDALQAEKALRQQNLQQRRLAFANQLRSLERELAQAHEEARLAHHRAKLAHKNAARYEQLAKEGFVSDLQAQGKQEELLDWQGRAQAASRAASALQREWQSVQREQADAASQSDAELARIERDIAALGQDDTENEAKRQLVVAAPQSGLVTALHIPVGGAVQAGQALGTLAPQAASGQPLELQAALYAPSRTAGFVHAGQEVWLRYAAYPYQKFGMARGVVSTVSRTPINAQDMPPGHAQALALPSGMQEPRYRITVKLDRQQVDAYGAVQRLVPGMTLDADVVQERRSLAEWAFEPIIAIKKRLSTQMSPT
jgi:membrane fusion protein